MYSSRIGRWLSVDPYAQYWSPYLAMGNNPVSRIDPDGGFAICPTCPGGSQFDVYRNSPHYFYYDQGIVSNFDPVVITPTSSIFDPVVITPTSASLPKWTSDFNFGVNAFGVANSAKTELMEYAVRSNYKSARSWSSFNRLNTSQQSWRTINTLGKTGANYLKYAKGLGAIGAGVTSTYSVANAGVYYYNGGTNWQVGTKAALDVVMTGVGFLGPVGFGISASYFILDATTGGFGGFGQIEP
jgi:hypothetical protein